MHLLYSVILSLAFLAMIPLFILRREKYASGFKQRLGNYPEFTHDDRKVIWLHCVSVGETNAARPLVAALRSEFPDHRIVISTTTKTGQEVALKIFAEKADAIFYFPFDFKFSVRRALKHYRPSLVLLMETEIWPRFIHEAKTSGSNIAIVNGRLSQRSFERYMRVRSFISRVLANVDLALMQNEPDAKRIVDLGIDPLKVAVTGNVKFDLVDRAADTETVSELRSRFGFGQPGCTVIIAGSTHEGEEHLVIDALRDQQNVRLIIAPRHPERFDTVANSVRRNHSFVRRSDAPAESDTSATVVLLDTVGELRAAYEVADIAIVCGSFVPHGGQNVLEPAAVGKPIITGPHTFNFASVVSDLLNNEAMIQIGERTSRDETRVLLSQAIVSLRTDNATRLRIASNARSVIEKNRGATQATINKLKALFGELKTDS